MFGDVFGASGPSVGRLGGENADGVQDGFGAFEAAQAFVDEGFGDRSGVGDGFNQRCGSSRGDKVGRVGSFRECCVGRLDVVHGQQPVVAFGRDPSG